MADTFTIRQNDTLPNLAATLLDANGDAVNLTGATVVFRMVPRHGGTAVIDNRSVTVVSAAAGTVSMTWQAADTDTEGTYLGNFIVTFGGGSIETFPNAEPLIIEIPKAL